MKVKVCGMKYNPKEVAALNPDYLGFIFYAKSPRNYTEEIIDIPSNIKRVGVFVNESLSEIVNKIDAFQLNVVQLHGDETEIFCSELKELKPEIEIWKAVSVKDKSDVGLVKNYLSVDKILFDTKGVHPGGNGIKFNWGILENLEIEKPFVLSGGIKVADIDAIKRLKSLKSNLEIIDINSQFESEPGRKELNGIRDFIKELNEVI